MGNNNVCCKYFKKENSEFHDNYRLGTYQSIKQLVNLQATFRGYIFRKKQRGSVLYDINNKTVPFDMDKIPGKIYDPIREKYLLPVEGKKISELKLQLTKFELNEKETYAMKSSHLQKFSIQYPDSSCYSGSFNRSWQREGYGVLHLLDGSLYEGFFKANQMQGRGRLLNSEGFCYEGDFEQNKANGFGKYISLEGITYIGYWKDEKQHGFGEESFPDGSKYEGNYLNGRKNGKGKFLWPDNYYYEGDFEDNDIHGQGIYRWKDGRIYQGSWKRNKMDGNGIFIWPDKKKYIGSYKEDNKHGYGIFFWPDGKKVEGCWHHGKQHGYGIFTKDSLTVQYCEWRNGTKIHTFDKDDKVMIKKILEEIKIRMNEYNFKDIEKYNIIQN
jgi:hypothetical protein